MKIFRTSLAKPPLLPQVQESEINPYESPRSRDSYLSNSDVKMWEAIFYSLFAVFLGTVIAILYKNRASDCPLDKIVERLTSESNEDVKWKMIDLKMDKYENI